MKNYKYADVSVSTLVNCDLLKRRRFYITDVAGVIPFLEQNELSFGGDYEAGFNKLFHYTLMKSDQLATICTYTSPGIQNYVIATMAEMITKSFADDVKSADFPFFSLVVDGSRNKCDKGSVQRLMQEHCGRVIPYVHCFSHRLHLWLSW